MVLLKAWKLGQDKRLARDVGVGKGKISRLAIRSGLILLYIHSKAPARRSHSTSTLFKERVAIRDSHLEPLTGAGLMVMTASWSSLAYPTRSGALPRASYGRIPALDHFHGPLIPLGTYCTTDGTPTLSTLELERLPPPHLYTYDRTPLSRSPHWVIYPDT